MTKIKFINKARKAAILPMLAVSMVALIGIIALAVDIGILAQTKSQLQSAADAAALSGSRGLTGDTSTDNNCSKWIGIKHNSSINHHGANPSNKPIDNAGWLLQLRCSFRQVSDYLYWQQTSN